MLKLKMVSIFAKMIMKKMEVQKDFIFDMKNVKEFRKEFEKMFLSVRYFSRRDTIRPQPAR